MTTLTGGLTDNIGQFYIGSGAYPEHSRDVPTLYDAADLTTHAVIIGMTGSGKTGLGISLLEEAALDGIPVIAIDPKGDLGNLALTFPNLAAEDFAPWVDASMATQAGMSVAEFAAQTASSWQNGLTKTLQTPERVRALQDSNRVRIYTPGSETGVPLALLGNLVPPPTDIRSDAESYAEYLDASVAALLVLIKMGGDNLAAEHVFMVQLLKTAWDQGQTLTLVDLIMQIQSPPFDTLGVLPLSQVFDERARANLAMKLNTLLASPTFASWLKGAPLDAGSLYYDSNGKAQTSVLNISHLSDEERMFFVTLLLNNLIGWMRRQQGTSTLRAILYMDEVFGYLPPTANPPSKVLLLTLLKQARAFGVGVVLSTQNPIDLDYKALSNAGTWFIGRLQTAQDRARVTDGLLSASSAGMDKQTLNDWFDQLGKRQFLLHNVHESEPVIFQTRWAMSYLAGPLTKEQISLLKDEQPNVVPAVTAEHTDSPAQASSTVIPTAIPASSIPALPKDITAYFIAKDAQVLATHTASTSAQHSADMAGQITHYTAYALAYARVFFNDRKSGTQAAQQLLLTTPMTDSPIIADWHDAQVMDVAFEQLQAAPHQPANLPSLPTAVLDKATWRDWDKQCTDAIRQQQTLSVWYCEQTQTYSDVGESEASFRQRLSVPLHEHRDLAIAKLKDSYAKQQQALAVKIDSVTQRLQSHSDKASQGWMDAGMSIGSAMLGAFTGRKTLSQRNINNVRRAMRQVSSAGDSREQMAVLDAQKSELQQQMDELQHALVNDLQQLASDHAPSSIALQTQEIRPYAKDISIMLMGVLYVPV